MLRNIMATTSKKARKAVPVLTMLIPLAALISIVNVAIAMSTSNWLDSAERIPISNTSIMEEFMIKRTVSGLWYLCTFNLTEKQQRDSVSTVPSDLMNCSSIEYFVKDRYTSDPNDSTNAIRFAVTKAGPLFVLASIMMGFAVMAAIFGYQRHRRIALFISGIAFIVAGLMLLIGLVVYLSALQSEIGPKLRPKNTVDLPQFSYKYGYSFLLVVVGFMATELTGILAIFYYIYWHQLDWTQKLGSTNDLMANGNNLNLHGTNGGDIRSGKSSDNVSSFKCNSRHHQSSSKQGYKIMDIYDNNSTVKMGPHYHSCNAYLLDNDIPFPPPPPPSAAYLSIPRDYTTLTSCSDEEGSVLFPPPPPACATGSMGRNKDTRNSTTVV